MANTPEHAGMLQFPLHPSASLLHGIDEWSHISHGLEGMDPWDLQDKNALL